MSIEEMEKAIQIILKQQTRILQILENDDKIGEKGVVARLSILEKKVLTLIITKRVNSGLWGILGGTITAFIFWIINEFKN